MSKRTDEARELGIAIGRREASERLLQFLQAQLTLWESQENAAATFRGKLRAHFLAGVTEMWCSRIRAVSTAIERDLVQLKSDEATRREACRKGLLSWI